jgi:hypothetical protein
MTECERIEGLSMKTTPRHAECQAFLLKLQWTLHYLIKYKQAMLLLRYSLFNTCESDFSISDKSEIMNEGRNETILYYINFILTGVITPFSSH